MKASTEAQTRRIWTQRILVGFIARPDQPCRGRLVQARAARGRAAGHGGVTIGRFAAGSSQSQPPFPAETPVHGPAGRHDAAHLASELLLQRRPPRYELEA